MKTIIKNRPAIIEKFVIAIKTPSGFYFLDTTSEFMSRKEAVEKYGDISGLCIIPRTDVK